MDNASSAPDLTTSYVFDREIVLEWYDSPIQSLVHCHISGHWLYKWLVAWSANSEKRTYVFRHVPDEWIERLLASLGEQPSKPTWVLTLEASRNALIRSLTDELFSLRTNELFISEINGAENVEALLRSIDPDLLGPLARPVTIETIVDEDERERLRIHMLAHSSPPPS